MIELRQVTRTYGPTPRRARPTIALEDVSLSVPEGETWAVVGPNGAGKTTLFALTLGFIHPTAGQVRLAGLAPRAYLRRHGAAFLPERFNLPGEWSVDAALNALAQLEGVRGEEATRRADRAIERFGLGPHADRPLAALSRGLLQRVGLAQATLADRALVVLDEPTEGLDPLWRIHFRELVAELRREGRTILIASHDLAEVERIAERVVILEAGRIREILPARSTDAGTERRFRIELIGPSPAVSELFPGATPVEADAAGATYLVTVADHDELSTRLAALLAAGATLAAVAPVEEPLEDRVHRALSGGAS